MSQAIGAAIRKNTQFWSVVCAVLGVVVLATFFAKETQLDQFWHGMTLAKVILYLVFLILLLTLVRGVPRIGSSFQALPNYVRRFIVILPILAVVFAVINAAFPEVSWLVRMSDNDIFRRPGALARAILELTACGYFVTLVYRSLRQRRFMLGGTLLLLSAALFVMGMEEISWGQRIFEWRTTGFFASHNAQGETNLHNLATQLFQNTLFFGGFVLLAVLPFFHDQLARLLKGITRLRYLVDFLPAPWMLLAFGAGLMFVDPEIATYGIHWDSILFQLIATMVLLGVLTYRLHTNRNDLHHYALLTFVCGAFVLVLSLSFDNLWLNYNQGLPTEYLKLYIIFGITCWAYGVRQRLVKTLAR